MIIQEFVFEMWCGMSEFDHRIKALLKHAQKRESGLRNSGLNGDSYPDLCDAGGVLHQLSCKAYWEQVVT